MAESGGERARPRPGSGLASPLVLGLLACTALALWLVWPAFAAGHIVNLDAPRHLLRSQVMAQQFLPSGHVDGWSPWWYLGAQLFLFQSYGYFFLIGASTLLLQGLGAAVTVEQVFKVWYVLPIVVLPAATAWMALRLGVTKCGALAAALAGLTFSSSIGYGMHGMFAVGLLLQGVGIIGFALAWPLLLDVLLHRDRSLWPAVLVTAALVLGHFISGTYALTAAGFVALGVSLRQRDPRPLVRYTMLALIVVLLAGHSLLPSLELRGLAGTGVGWGLDQDRFDRFLVGTLFGAQPLALAAMAAAVWAMFRGPAALSISAVVFFTTALVGGANEQGWEPAFLGRIFEVLFRPRALPYAVLFQAIFVGVAVDVAVAAAGRMAAGAGRPSLARIASPLAIAAILFVALPEAVQHRRMVRTTSSLRSPDRPVYRQLVAWLRTHVAPPAIVAVPRTLLPHHAIGARSVVSLLNLDTGLYTLGGDQAELSRSSRHSGRLDLDKLDKNTARGAALLRAAAVSYVIVSKPALRSRLRTSPEFELAFEYSSRRQRRKLNLGRGGKPQPPLGVSVFRVRRGGTWLQGPRIRVQSMEHSPERISWTLRAQPGEQPAIATAAVNWHPNWTATVDGVRVPTTLSTSRHVSFEVAPEAQRVTLEFVRSTREKAWDALSAGTLLLVLAAWWRQARAPGGPAARARRRGLLPGLPAQLS